MSSEQAFGGQSAPRSGEPRGSAGATTQPNPAVPSRTAPPRPAAGSGRPPGLAGSTATTGPNARVAMSGPRPGQPRKVRLTVARVDPWSVMKLAFLLSVALGVVLVVAVAVLWGVLDGMGVFSDINRVSQDVAGSESHVDILAYVGFGRVVSLVTVIAVVDVILLTALSTLGAFLYNVSASLVGGLHVTLSDD